MSKGKDLIKELDKYSENLKYIENLNKDRKLYRIYKEKEYEKKKIKFNNFLGNVMPIVLCGFTVMVSSILFAQIVKNQADDKLNKTLRDYPDRPLSYYLAKEGLISDGKVFEYGTSNDSLKIEKILKGTQSCFYIQELSEKYGMPAIQYIMDNYTIIDSDGYFVYFNFMQGVDYIEDNSNKFALSLNENEGKDYIQTIFKSVNNPELKYCFNGEEVGFFLENDIAHLCWSSLNRGSL